MIRSFILVFFIFNLNIYSSKLKRQDASKDLVLKEKRVELKNPLQINNSINNAFYLSAIQKKVNASFSVQTVINVLHIGDSHIKSGFFSEPIMQKLNMHYSQRYNNKLFFNFQWFCKVGTKYSDYNGMKELDVQLISSQPDLVIISLGTNDAFSGSSRVGFYSKIDHLIKKIKNFSPSSVILITTPPDALKFNTSLKRYAEIPELSEVVRTIIKYCLENKIPYWNLYQIMGGNYSIKIFLSKRLAAPDHIHYTAKGYGTFAQWLFEAFTKSIH